MPVIKEEADEQTIFDRGEFAQLLEDLTFNSREIIGKITNFARLKRDVMTKDIHEMLTAKLREVIVSFPKIPFTNIILKVNFLLSEVFEVNFWSRCSDFAERFLRLVFEFRGFVTGLINII